MIYPCSLKSPSVYPVCLDAIVDATVEKEGQEAIYCKNICNSWIHAPTGCRLITSLIQVLSIGWWSILLPSLPIYYPVVSDTRFKVNHWYFELGNHVNKKYNDTDSKVMSPSWSPSQDTTKIASSTLSDITSSQQKLFTEKKKPKSQYKRIASLMLWYMV